MTVSTLIVLALSGNAIAQALQGNEVSFLPSWQTLTIFSLVGSLFLPAIVSVILRSLRVPPFIFSEKDPSKLHFRRASIHVWVCTLLLGSFLAMIAIAVTEIIGQTPYRRIEGPEHPAILILAHIIPLIILTAFWSNLLIWPQRKTSEKKPRQNGI